MTPDSDISGLLHRHGRQQGTIHLTTVASTDGAMSGRPQPRQVAEQREHAQAVGEEGTHSP